MSVVVAAAMVLQDGIMGLCAEHQNIFILSVYVNSIHKISSVEQMLALGWPLSKAAAVLEFCFCSETPRPRQFIKGSI